MNDLPLVTALKNKGVDVRFSGDEHIVLTCPKCERETKLYYNYKKHIGDCKVCGTYFRLLDLYEHFQISASYKAAPNINDIKKRLKKAQEKKEALVLPEVDFPEDCIERLPIIAENFLQIRQVPHSYWEDLRWCRSGFYGTSIVVPVHDENNRMVGFQARKLFSREGQDKYLFNKGASKKLFLYNMTITKYVTGPVIVVENVFNAMWLYGVTTFGKQISDEQIQMLSKCKAGCVVIWDYDAWTTGTAYKILEKMKRAMKVRAIMLTPEKPQPDHWTKDELQHAAFAAMNGTQLVYRMDIEQ